MINNNSVTQNNIYIYKYALLISIFLGSMAKGQFRPKENYPTPQVSSLGQYGNTPTNLYTGQINISIPITEIKEGDIDLPISLSYNLTSVKPNRRSGWVGLGWNLNTGGYITRNVRGVYDEQQDIAKKSIGFYDNHSKLEDISDQTSLYALYLMPKPLSMITIRVSELHQ